MLQMVRTLAQFSIALEEMSENGQNTGDEGGGGERDCGSGGGGGGGGVLDRDALDQIRNNNRNSSQNLNGNGLPPSNGEVVFLFFWTHECLFPVCSSSPCVSPLRVCCHFLPLLSRLSLVHHGFS